MDNHEHSLLPARCCLEEPPEEVLSKLRATPPTQRGKRKKNIITGAVEWFSTEPDSAFRQRQEAWQMAIDREQTACK